MRCGRGRSARRSPDCGRGSPARASTSPSACTRSLRAAGVDVRLDVAHRAGIPVPIPRAPEVAAFLDHPDVADTGLAQTSGGEQSAEAATDHDDVDVVEQRVAFGAGDVGVVDIVGELTDDLAVLLVAVFTEALVALFSVLGPQRVRIERRDDGLFDDRHD